MKKIILLICASVVSLTSAVAQSDNRSVEASGIRMIRSGENVTVQFTLNTGKKTTKASENLVVSPFLRGDAAERELPSIVIRGRRSKVLDARHELATRERLHEQTPVYVTAGESVDYAATLPYESWMRGGQLVFEGVRVGCCSSKEVQLGLIAENILYAEPEIETRIVEVPVVIPNPTTGDRLAEQYPFVTPLSQLAQTGTDHGDMPLDPARGNSATRNDEEQSFIDTTARDGSISIYFRQGSHAIDRKLGDNNKNLVELISAVRVLAEADDSSIAKIVIAGFTSPEGGIALNERLGRNRAMEIKEFLAANSGIDPQAVTIYNGAVDWAGLKELVAKSDIHNKQQIINVIDNTPVWDSSNNVGRLGELMRMDGGKPYRYMLANFFPQLRQAAYIKVYYENNTK